MSLALEGGVLTTGPPGKYHHIVSELACLLRLPLAVTVSQTFHVFDDLDSFEASLPGISQNAPLLGAV